LILLQLSGEALVKTLSLVVVMGEKENLLHTLLLPVTLPLGAGRAMLSQRGVSPVPRCHNPALSLMRLRFFLSVR
jgi:hypothetical protein